MDDWAFFLVNALCLGAMCIAEDCTDNEPDCGTWAADGECKRYPDWMETPRVCEACKAGQTSAKQHSQPPRRKLPPRQGDRVRRRVKASSNHPPRATLHNWSAHAAFLTSMASAYRRAEWPRPNDEDLRPIAQHASGTDDSEWPCDASAEGRFFSNISEHADGERRGL